jgi:hypothetical protein
VSRPIPPIPPIPPITGVTGGVAGLSATYADVLALADLFTRAAAGLRDRAADDARALTDADLVESAPLSPMTFGEAEARVLEAASGAHGVVEAAVAYETDAWVIRAVVTSYQECDRFVAASFDVLDEELGRAAGSAVRVAAPSLLLAGLVAVPAWRHLPGSVRRRLGGDLEALVEEHPEAVQHAADGSGGLLDGLLGLPPLHPTAGDAAADLARLYPPEGEPVLRRRGDLATRLGKVPPPDLAGLLRHLEQTSALSAPGRPGADGTIEIQSLHGADGRVRYVVYLPGTDDPGAAPWSHDADVRDLPADLREIAGQHTAYAAGIERAMAESGIGPHDPVLLVGHSLGGMEAASLLAHGSGYDVTHVVTAGSPIAGVHGFPPGTHVLSLENRGDLVPLLDGQDNPGGAHQVTVQFDDPGTSVLDAHGLRHYVHGAAAADASDDRSVREQLASLRAHGFLGSDSRATSRVFQISR